MLRIKGWSSFQSYSDRKPPWIRLHKSLLDNFEFQSLSVGARALLPMLWLLASEDEEPTSGLIRYGYEKIAFRLRMEKEDVKALITECIAANFIEQQSQEVTDSLRNGYATVTPETETETETEVGDTSARARDMAVEMNFEIFYRAYPGLNKGRESDGQKGSRQKAQVEWRKAVTMATSEEIIGAATGYRKFLQSTNGIAKAAHNWLHEKGWETNYAMRTDNGGRKMPSPAGG